MMLPLILLTCLSTVFALTPTYQLRVYAGNDNVDSSLLAFDDTDAAFVPTSRGLGDSSRPIFIRPGPQTSALGTSLVAVQSPDDIDPKPWYVALLGASRKAQYRMVASEYDRTFDFGTTFLFDDWRFVEYGERVVLRYGDNKADASHWVVAKRAGGWILWWMEPTDENMGDIGDYVLVDVEVELVEEEEGER